MDLARLAMIKTDDIPLQDDAHFSTESYLVIGERLAQEYLNITGGPWKYE